MRAALVIVLTLVLGACSVAPKVSSEQAKQLWSARQPALKALSSWLLEGRVAFSSANDGGNASLRWRQHGDDFRILMVAPFGQGTVSLRGGPGGVVLRSSDHPQPVLAPDAESLLQRQLGWHVPVRGMRYWVIGLPDPRDPPHIELDDRGRIAHLQQAGWKVDFRRYQSVDGVQLPEKIFMENKDLRVRMVVQRWRLGG